MLKVAHSATTPDLLIPDIESELIKLSEKQSEGKQIKACLFTLIIYSAQAQRTAYLQDLADTILDKFPCRMIFIQCDSQETRDFLHVDVSSITSGKKENLVVCDRISIETSPSQLSRIPFLVLPYIVSDLPVYLLWGQNPFEENVVFPRLQPFASRVLFDSQCSENLTAFCQQMLKCLAELQMDVMDVNWAMLSNWRDMLAQLFDTEEKLEHLRASKSIQITYNSRVGDLQPAIRAMYLQGWLAARLKWHFHDYEQLGDTHVFSYTASSLPVIVSLAPQHLPDLPAGALIGIEIKTHNGYTYQIMRKAQQSQVVVHVTKQQLCDMPFSLPLPNVYRGLHFMKEMFFHKLSDHYRDMLNMVAQISKKESKSC